MSELANRQKNWTGFRRGLLTTASVIALLGFGTGRSAAADGADDRPTVWIELGGQLSRLEISQEPFSPPNMADRSSNFSPSGIFEKPALYSFDETGKITFEPAGTDWVFSAAVRYGRSTSNRDVRQGTHPKPFVQYLTHPTSGQTYRHAVYPVASQFANTSAKNSESHLVLDFRAGKDVGLGMFGGHGSSTVNLGVRFAQFSSDSNIALQSDPDWHFSFKYLPNGFAIAKQAFHTNMASLVAERSFRGIGPSLSWNGSAPVGGDPRDGELSIDGGLNAAVLFGRQRAQVHHQMTGEYRSPVSGSGPGPRYVTYQPGAVDHARSRTVTVPNVGGFAGLTFRVENFKMSAGYRADLFFGPMDGGIDAAKKENVGFYGPFASVSVGLGG